MAVDEYGQHRGPYGTEFRRRVYQVWAYQCGRDAKLVHKLLTEDPQLRDAVGLEDDEAAPTAKTIMKWAEVGQWSWQAMKDMQDSFPVGVRYGAIKVTTLGYEAPDQIQKILAKHGSGENLTGSDKIALDSWFKLLDLTYGENISTHIRNAVDPDVNLEELKHMTLDQLADAERRMLGS